MPRKAHVTPILEWLKAEPVRAYSAVLAAITVATSFGLDLSTEQRAAVLGLAAVVLGVGSQAVRAKVTPWQAPPDEPDNEVGPA